MQDDWTCAIRIHGREILNNSVIIYKLLSAPSDLMLISPKENIYRIKLVYICNFKKINIMPKLQYKGEKKKTNL